jgi:hypothetical protein
MPASKQVELLAKESVMYRVEASPGEKCLPNTGANLSMEPSLVNSNVCPGSTLILFVAIVSITH